jgi:amino acid adenylation domain-containing protein
MHPSDPHSTQTLPGLPPAGEDVFVFPASFAQRRLWFLDQLDPGGSSYNMPLAVRLAGRLDAGALAASLREVVARHETLRTTFTVRDGEPFQVVVPSGDVPLPVIDLRGSGDAGEEARDLAAREARRPFDLSRGPLLRTVLLRLGEEEHLLLLTMHHIVSDGWSLGVLLSETAALYGAFAAGRPSPLPELPIQYADFALWQQDRLRGEGLAALLRYWSRQLHGLPPALDLPTDMPRPARRTPAGGSRQLLLPADVAAALQALSRSAGATLFMTLLAAFQALLFRLTGQEDLAVGTPSANRGRSETQGLIGLFVNTLVLRGDLSGDPGLGELLARVRETVLEADAHQDLPFEKLVEELAPERDLGTSPLFQAMLTLHSLPAASLEWSGLRLTPFETGTGEVKFDLSLALREVPEGISGSLEYSADLFEAATADRVARCFATLVAGIAAAPDRRLSELPWVPEEDLRQLLHGWSRGGAAAPGEESLHELFEAQVERGPDAGALVWRGERLTYGELNERANRLARHLRRLGVGPDVRVGLCAERSVDLIVGLLGVLKAGGAYVPLDPVLPAGRLRFMVEDSRAALVVSHAATEGRLPPAVRQVRLDGDRREIDRESGDNPPSSRLPGCAAYVIYTSGSTGAPKGVVVPHAAVTTFIRTLCRDYGLGPEDRFLQFASLGFDVSVWEIHGALASGATLVLRDDAALEQPEDFLRSCAERGITVMDLPTALWHEIAMLPEPRLPASLRLFFIGSERALPERAERWRERMGGRVRLINAYGPTETTVTATAADLAVARLLPGREVSVGRPVAGTEVYIVSRDLRPTAPGIPGELVLGGPRLARGYLDRPGLTAERFVPHPYASEPGERLYRTGDRARFQADGEIEFLGRIDHQVKVRGFRIELGEIETVLAAHAAVAQAVVVAREDVPGDVRLAAYVVPEAASAAGLPAYLREKLPDYMVPAWFTFLPALPLTAGGKVDRRALPAPERTGGEPGAAPRTPTEELLAAIFGEVLELAAVGVNDSFFALGGHSLLATRLVSRVRGAFGVELPLRALFDGPTVAGLAAAVDAALRGGGGLPAAPPVRPLAGEGAAPLSFSQERLWFLEQLEPGAAAYNIPLALRLTGALDPAVLERALTEIVRRHGALRTVFSAVEGRPVQTVAAAAPLALPRVDLAALPAASREREVSRLTAEDARRPFDLSRGPFLRALLLRTGGGEHVVSAVMHHIASDGWSLEILAGEIAALYAAFAGGRPSPLPELPVQYADFAVWQRGWLRGEALEAQLAYWRERLAGSPPSLTLPLERPRPPVQTSRGAVVTVDLPGDLAGPLRRVAQGFGATAFMTFLAAFAALLQRVTGQADLVIGAPIAGRTRAETEGLIGFFLNTLALRVDLAGDPPFGDLLDRVRQVTLGAYAHQDLPFERLLEELQPERDPSRTPLFQVVFNWLRFGGVHHPPMRLPGLALEPLETAAPVAKFDLEIYAEELADGVVLRMVYNRDLYEPPTLLRLAAHFESVLREIARDPGRPLSALPLLSPAERHQLLAEWGDTAAADARDGRCLHELVAAQARRTPEAVAVIFGDARLTYRELDDSAGRLARRLAAAGLGPGRYVPVLMEAGPDLVVAMLAAMRAGAAFVPLDVEWPTARLAAVLSEIGDLGGVVLADGSAPDLGEVAGWSCLRLDRLEGEAPAAPLAAAGPEDPIYAIYTSGSTGRPKGVVVPHRGIVNRFLWMDRFFAPGAAATVLQTTRSVYDSAVWQIFWPLIQGGATVLTPPRLGLDPESLAGLIARHRVTMVDFVPAIFKVVVERLLRGEERTESFASLRAVVVGGEEMETAPAHAFRALFPGVLLVNLYGPTEASIGCICHAVGEESGRVPIGRPISNAQALVLDPAGQPQPVGVAGELCLTGRCLGLGYLRDPEATAGAFVANPFPGIGSSRMYRTGDLARFLPDGRLDFLGRKDHQVKIRGLRIELGEIESVLREAPGVVQAVVLLQGAGKQDQRLVAYVVGRPGEAPAAAGLEGFLRGRLPRPMVPGAFVALDALPLTAGGKIDRQALSRLGPEPAGERVKVAPRTPYEEILAGCWAAVLQPDPTSPPLEVGVFDDFFTLGGHSLLATQIVSRVRQAFGVELPLRALFEEPTVAALARRIEAEAQAGRGAAAPPLRALPRDGRDLPLSFAQERLWFVDQFAPGNPAYNIVAGLRLEGPLDLPALGRAFDEIVARHESLRTVFATVGGEPVQRIAAAAAVPLGLADLAGLAAEPRRAETRRLASAEAASPFDLTRGPLLRVSLLRLAADRHALLIATHHIVFDGSMELFLFEMVTLYEAFAAGRPSPLAMPALQYADYAAWQRQWLRGEVLERQLAYWRQRLDGDLPPLELPTDRPRPAVQTSRGTRAWLDLPAEVMAGLEAVSRRSGVTLFMTTLAAFDTLLLRYTGRRDLLVGTPVVQRARRETEGIIGCFVNTLVLRGGLEPELGFDALLQQVREVTLAAYEHQDLPFELLVRALQPERSLSHTPLFQVMFVLLEADRQLEGLGMPGLTVAREEVGTVTARFDWLLSILGQRHGATCFVEYSSDLFDAATMARTLRHFEILLRGVAADPARPLLDLPLLSAAERFQSLAEWNDTGGAAAAPPCLHELFEARAARHPEAVAVVCGGAALTYGELNAAANRLARLLRSLGIGPGDFVAVHLERRPEMIPALLGILKSGAAYVPVETSLPEARIRFILEALRVPCLVTQGSRLAVLANSLDGLPALGHAVCVDAPPADPGPARIWTGADLAGFAAADLPPLAGPESMAYVIFTSGSTGTPKGVAVRHRPASNLIAWVSSTFGVGPEDRVLLVTSLSFDLSVYDIFGLLAAGGSVHVATGPEVRDPERLVRLLREEPVTFWDSAPAALQQLVPFLPPQGDEGSRLRLVFLSGDWIPVPLPERITRAFPAARVIALGGATEATVWSNFHPVERIDPAWVSIPYGRPILGARYHVLDAAGGPCPIGVAGDLWIGGECLAAGYANAPELTADRFVPDPFAVEPGARLYRTGDRARYRPDGNLEFLGRLDQQVKIRGFRVELGEIETVLASHPDVREAVVGAATALRRPPPGGLRGAAAAARPRRADPARVPPRPAAGVHGAAGGGGAAGDPAHRQRQGGPQGPPGTRGRAGRRGDAGGAPHPHPGAAGRHLVGAPRRRAGRPRRRFLRARRPLAAGHPARLPGARPLPRRAPPARRVRGADAGGPGRPGRRSPPRRRRPLAAPAADAARRRPAALLRPAAVVVPASARPRGPLLSPPGGVPPRREARRRRPRSRPRRSRPPPRSAADLLSRSGGKPSPGRPSGRRPGAAGGRPAAPAAGGARGAGPRAGAAADGPPLRPGARPPVPRHPAAPGRGGSRHRPGPAPHRGRRLVAGGDGPGDRVALPGLLAGGALAPARARRAVSGLRPLAASMAAGRGAGAADRLLEGAPGERAAGAGAPLRPPPAGRAERRRRDA